MKYQLHFLQRSEFANGKFSYDQYCEQLSFLFISIIKHNNYLFNKIDSQNYVQIIKVKHMQDFCFLSWKRVMI